MTRPPCAVRKRGPGGTAVLDGEERHEVGGLQVEVVNGLGAGDAFAAAMPYRLELEALLKGQA